ncbi:MAG TPA: hypothetical protein VF621_07790, partial [Pyrinomonadaceae bacterium]
MSDKEKRPDRVDYDLTSPNVYPARGEQPRRPPADDRTAINNPVRPATEMPPRPAPPNKYDLTSVNVRAMPLDDEDDSRAPHYPPHAAAAPAPAAPPHVAPPPRPRGRVPAWLWAVLGVSLVVLVLCGGLLAYLFLSAPSTFTLRVLDAPAGQVYVDGVPSGVRQRDGSIIIQGLRAGEPRVVSVRQEGFAEWKTTLTGRSGEVMDVRA